MDLFKERINAMDFESMSYHELISTITAIQFLESTTDDQSPKIQDYRYIIYRLEKRIVSKVDAQFFGAQPPIVEPTIRDKYFEQWEKAVSTPSV